MRIKHVIAALAATTMLGTGALADEGPKHKKKNRSAATSVSAGAAAADRRGAVAGGISAAQATREQERRARRGEQVSRPSAVSTNTTGAVYTDRRHGSAAISTQGSATGDGSVRSSSEGEVYSSTTRRGSEADAYGVSEAEADEPRRDRDPDRQ
jgi:hypothetical protein